MTTNSKTESEILKATKHFLIFIIARILITFDLLYRWSTYKKFGSFFFDAWKLVLRFDGEFRFWCCRFLPRSSLETLSVRGADDKLSSLAAGILKGVGTVFGLLLDRHLKVMMSSFWRLLLERRNWLNHPDSNLKKSPMTNRNLKISSMTN